MTSVEFNKVKHQLSIGGKTVTLETGELARQAGGAVVLTCGETVLLVTATVASKPRPGIDFFPLLVDFEEKMYAVGRMPGGYIKREGRPSEKAVLTSRLIDRPIRPLFPDGYRNDVQIVALPLSLDSNNPPDTLAILGASAALSIAKDAPFLGPIGAVRVAIGADGQFIANPTFDESKDNKLDLIVAGTKDSIMMVEAGANFVDEATMIDAIAFAQGEICKQVDAQLEFAKMCGVEKQAFVADLDTKPLYEFIKANYESQLDAAYHDFDRESRQQKLEAIKNELDEKIAALPEDDALKVLMASTELNIKGECFKKVEKLVMRRMIMNESVRADGRKLDEIRPISCRVGLLPKVHGSALFTRGSTQVLSICTLGAADDVQELDGVDPQKEKRWIHHYAFPGYSTGEVRPMRGVGRREVGHGALAERGNASALPSPDVFGYTIRVNSEVLESNGSSSMASTCGASMALMDAGVPVSCPIGGIAMGLIKEGNDFKVLSDIQGVEDFLGDMDFKVTGNRSGITALQMDIKITGISLEIIRTALTQANSGRLHILDKMAEAISEPREEVSPNAPKLMVIQIDPDSIGAVIGPGGKNIKAIIAETDVSIDIQDDGKVTIAGDTEGCLKAKQIIELMTLRPEPGMLLQGKVVRILPIGAIVEFGPGKDGMVHISQLADRRVETVDEVVSLGQEVTVKVLKIDERGRVNLSIKAVTEEEKGALQPA